MLTDYAFLPLDAIPHLRVQGTINHGDTQSQGRGRDTHTRNLPPVRRSRPREPLSPEPSRAWSVTKPSSLALTPLLPLMLPRFSSVGHPDIKITITRESTCAVVGMSRRLSPPTGSVFICRASTPGRPLIRPFRTFGGGSVPQVPGRARSHPTETDHGPFGMHRDQPQLLGCGAMA
jgi:hypothetical protein